MLPSTLIVSLVDELSIISFTSALYPILDSYVAAGHAWYQERTFLIFICSAPCRYQRDGEVPSINARTSLGFNSYSILRTRTRTRPSSTVSSSSSSYSSSYSCYCSSPRSGLSNFDANVS